jgi:hypothetical protein
LAVVRRRGIAFAAVAGEEAAMPYSASRSANPRRNKHDRANMKRAVVKRHANPSTPRKFPEKDNVHPVTAGKKGDTNDDPNHPSQTGDAAATRLRRRQTRRG